MSTMTKEQADAFATSWIEEWNRRDIEAVLKRYAENCVFVSSRAASFAHAPTIVGKAQLRAYFEKALVGVPELRFELDHSIWDPSLPALVMVHIATIQAKKLRECEVLYFDAEGLIQRDEAFYGGATVGGKPQ